ncbi:hypothetical protein RM533_05445 [Croceicoccus sp. F390]|uniref:DUF4402 domain-containing protein n=1 Tax=Croceicoccus esteveae TaxID=3075597 RepID=A0ABU2ZGA5_9SPHN|nr:hypothetical protein [Croceicoccus sp. F390]MDT0575623.1 hypothetical protein [Croceicoccus sp. F390]
MNSLLLIAAQALATASPVFSVPAEPDGVLAQQRGGIRLPSGIDAALTVQTQTALNGDIVLQTVVKIDKGAPVFTTYVPGPGEKVPGQQLPNTAATGSPAIAFDGKGGFQISAGSGTLPVTVTTGAPGAGAGLPAGLQAVDSAGPVATDNGLVMSQTGSNGLQNVQLSGSDFTIIHFGVNAFGSAIFNTGSDRVIDTATIVSIDLDNAGPDVLGSAMLRVESVALDALASRL